MVKVYYSEGMSHHVSKFLDLTGLHRLDHLTELDVPCIWMSIYTLDDYMRFRNHSGAKIVYWHGTDVLIFLGLNETQNNSGEVIPATVLQNIVKSADCLHVCQNELLKQELATVGIEALVRPLFMEDIDEISISYQYKERPSVYTMVSNGRHEFYGIPWIYEIADQANADFYIYGYEGEDTSNVFHFPYLPEAEFNERIKQHQAFLRLPKHDGFSQCMVKALMMGQYVFSRIDFPFVTYVSSPNELLKFLNDLPAKTESNQDKTLLKRFVNNFDWLEDFLESNTFEEEDEWSM